MSHITSARDRLWKHLGLCMVAAILISMALGQIVLATLFLLASVTMIGLALLPVLVESETSRRNRIGA